MLKYADIFPTKAQFLSDEELSFQLEWFVLEATSIRVQVELIDLDQVVDRKEAVLESEGGYFSREIIVFDRRSEGFKGFGVEASLYKNDKLIGFASTACDIVDSHKKTVRYGFLSDFFVGQEEDTASLDWMNKMHINYVQYYDWMYRHDDFIPKEEVFADLLDRKLSLKTICSRIKQAKKYGMQNLAYGAIYGATKELFEMHPEWALYNSANEPITFFDFLHIMNIHEHSPWHHYIINEYKKAIELGFNGIHMDTYGFPKVGFSIDGILQNLEDQFPVLIDHTKEQLKSVKEDVSLIFNNVGNWPVNTVAKANQEAIYIEVWDPYTDYEHIRKIIVDAKSWGGHKPVVLAAYLKPFNEDNIIGAENAALILTATITTCGGYHLLIGENNGYLTEGYYPNYYKSQNKGFNNRMRKYYDHIVRFMNIWFDESLRDVSLTHCKGDNQEYIIEGVSYSPNPISDKIWVTIKENKNMQMMSFINLNGNQDTIWNKEKVVVPTSSFKVKVQLNYKVESVFYSSPDQDNIMKKLKYEIVKNDRGMYAVIDVPSIEVWGTLVIKNQ
ncbi:glycoside hydrolase family 66 protein [Bacillus sp. 03113]|uniref:glycoside hydrolase family 66 protein n=1 Tax=Bacillus sp. 03113 TaxID=2578211 RepID=UPI0011438577|nr:glycoside hydrolase family 66 protein [Bacillus sp. 03113]